MSTGSCGFCRRWGHAACALYRVGRRIFSKVPERKGVWTGQAARVLAVGFLGMADQTMGLDSDMGSSDPKMSQAIADSLRRQRQAKYTDKVLSHLARQARIQYEKTLPLK